MRRLGAGPSLIALLALLASSAIARAACSPDACDDGDPCTVDDCDALGGCTHAAADNGTPCPDANLCDGTETCWYGRCVAHTGTPLDCDDREPCTLDGCDPATGCTHDPVANATPCPDANVCDGIETCWYGRCTPGTGTPLDCDDGNPCTVDRCDPDRGCRHENAANGTPCADANVCDGTETCLRGHCRAGSGTPLDCDDGDPCTTDTCDPASGCRSTPVPDCAASTPTTTLPPTDTCALLACDDGEPCTEDACIPGTGCVFRPVEGFAAVRCVCERPPVAACAGLDLPRTIARGMTRGCALIERASTRRARTGALVRKAARCLRRSKRIVEQGGMERKTSAACADAFGRALGDAEGRAERWLLSAGDLASGR